MRTKICKSCRSERSIHQFYKLNRFPMQVCKRCVQFYVYVLLDPRTETIFYVGVTYDLAQRLIAHIKESSPKSGRSVSRKNKVIADMIKGGFEPEIYAIEPVLFGDRELVEYYWLRTFIERGYELTNGKGGGNYYIDDFS